MARITGEIVIGRPIGEVFDFVADERNEPRYNPGLLRSDKVTDGPVGVGTRFAAVHAPARHPVDMIVEVTAYDRPRRFASNTTMSWAEVRGVLTFDAAGTGTRMRWAWDVRPKGLAKVLAPVVGVIGRRQERAVWEGLRRYLEVSGERDDAPSRRIGLAVLAALVALSAYGGALGLITGFLELGQGVTSRLPFDSPVLGALALTAIVAIPTTVVAWLAAHGHRRTGDASIAAGVLLIGWILAELAFIRELSFFHPAYVVLGGMLIWLGTRCRAPGARAARGSQ